MVRRPQFSRADIDRALSPQSKKQLHAEMQKMRRRVTELCLQSRGVYRFPDSILRIIFTIASKHESHHGVHPLAALVQTCSHWRLVLLNYPVLWTDIDFSRVAPAHADLFLKRSQNRPLSVRFDHRNVASLGSPTGRGSASNDFHVSWCSLHISRIVSLHLVLARPHLDFYTNPDAKLLETLFIQLPRGKDWALPELRLSRYPLLTALTFVNFRHPWHSPIYKQLKQLKIVFQKDCVLDSDIYQVFQNSPSLETITLISTGKSQLRIGDNRGRTATPFILRQLKEMTLTLTPRGIRYILSLIQTPLDLQVTINVVTNRGDKAHSIEFPLDPRCLPTFSAITTLSINSAQLMMLGRSKTGSVRVSSQSHMPNDKDQDIFREMFCNLRSNVSFPFLNELTLCGDPKNIIPEASLCAFISYLPSLHKLSLSQCDGIILHVLGVHATSSLVPFCPHLKTFEMQEMSFNAQDLKFFLLACSKDAKFKLIRLTSTKMKSKSADEASQVMKTIEGLTKKFEQPKTRVLTQDILQAAASAKLKAQLQAENAAKTSA